MTLGPVLHAREYSGNRSLGTSFSFGAIRIAWRKWLQTRSRSVSLVSRLFHSDPGVQYAAGPFRAALARVGLTASLSRRGNCYDNAARGSFFSVRSFGTSPGCGGPGTGANHGSMA
jgi:transposase InsO family protein